MEVQDNVEEIKAEGKKCVEPTKLAELDWALNLSKRKLMVLIVCAENMHTAKKLGRAHME